MSALVSFIPAGLRIMGSTRLPLMTLDFDYMPPATMKMNPALGPSTCQKPGMTITPLPPASTNCLSSESIIPRKLSTTVQARLYAPWGPFGASDHRRVFAVRPAQGRIAALFDGNGQRRGLVRFASSEGKNYLETDANLGATQARGFLWVWTVNPGLTLAGL